MSTYATTHVARRYSAFDIEDPVAAVRALATLGFAGNCGIAVRVTRALLGI